MSLTGLEQLEQLERDLVGVERRAAARAAPELLEVAKAQWAAGQSPTGEAWPLTEEGEVALTALTSQATGRAEDTDVVLELPDVLAFHQHPTQAGHHRRQVIPDEGDPVPPAWEAPIAAAIIAELEHLGELTMPTVFGLDFFQAAIQADFTANGVTSDLLIGTWNAEVHYGAPRVVIGRGRAKIEEPGGDAFGANGWIDPYTGTAQAGAAAARALLHRAQMFLFWVHSVAPPGTDPAGNAIAARQTTDALLDATLAAIRRSQGGLLLGWTDTEPLDEERGDFVYGSIVTFGVVIYIPVYDTPMPVAQAGEVEADAQMTVDGVDTPATPEAEDTTT